MKNLNTKSRVKPAQNFEKLQNYLQSQNLSEREKFHSDFRKLPRKLQLFIIRIVKEHNTANDSFNLTPSGAKMVLIWIDLYSVLNYSEHKIIDHVTDLYLR